MGTGIVSWITFWKITQVKKVFCILFIAMAGLLLVRVVDPVTTQHVVAIIRR